MASSENASATLEGWAGYAAALSTSPSADGPLPPALPIAAGANVKAVQRMLGHASAAMTALRG